MTGPMGRLLDCAVTVSAVLGSFALIQPVSARDWMAIAGGRVLTRDGSLESGKVMLIKNGVIDGLTTANDVPSSIPVTTVPDDAVIVPGLVALNSQIGCLRQNIAIAKVIDPAPNGRDAVDPTAKDLRYALNAGFTSAMVAPAAVNIVAGVSATFRTLPGEQLEVLAEVPLVFSLGRQVLRVSREPTSRSDAVRLLEECLTAAKKGEGSSRVRDFLSGRLSGLLFCSDELDVRSSMRAFGEVGRIPDLVYTPVNSDQEQTARLAQGLAGGGVRVVMGPFDWKTPESTLRAAGIFAANGVPIAFGCGLPSGAADSARRSAMLAVRFGMSPEAARRGLTSVAADIAGVGRRLGSLERGREADFVIFSGDPLRADSRVISVYVGGDRVDGVESQPETDQ